MAATATAPAPQIVQVSLMDTCTIFGVGVVAVAAISDLVVVLGEMFVVFAVVYLNLQIFQVASLAVVFSE